MTQLDEQADLGVFLTHDVGLPSQRADEPVGCLCLCMGLDFDVLLRSACFQELAALAIRR